MQDGIFELTIEKQKCQYTKPINRLTNYTTEAIKITRLLCGSFVHFLSARLTELIPSLHSELFCKNFHMWNCFWYFNYIFYRFWKRRNANGLLAKFKLRMGARRILQRTIDKSYMNESSIECRRRVCLSPIYYATDQNCRMAVAYDDERMIFIEVTLRHFLLFYRISLNTQYFNLVEDNRQNLTSRHYECLSICE